MSAKVPKIWTNGVCAIFGGGPSMSQQVADKCVRLKTIAINNSYQLAPWADVLYAADRRWWEWHPDAVEFQGLKFTVSAPVKDKRIHLLQHRKPTGLETDPHYIATGRNGGYQAVNLAAHLGAKVILLNGINCQEVDGREWWHDKHPKKNKPTIFATYLQHWPTIVQPLLDLKIKVINTTPDSALDCFEKMDLDEALAKFAKGL